MPKKAKVDKSLTVPVTPIAENVPEVFNASWQPPVLPVPTVEKTEAAKIWEEIKHVNLNMFALPGQTVEKYCKPIMIEPTKLYMTVTATSVLAALEDTLGKSFDIVPAGKFILVSRK